MARSPKLPPCQRCMYGRVRPAPNVYTFCIGAQGYEIRLCDEHYRMIDRDFWNWALLGDPVEQHPAAGERPAAQEKAGHRHDVAVIRDIQRRALTEHRTARQASVRITHRGIPVREQDWSVDQDAIIAARAAGLTLAEVLETAAKPQVSHEARWLGPKVWIYQRGRCRILVDRTTMRVTEILEDNPALDRVAQ